MPNRAAPRAGGLLPPAPTIAPMLSLHLYRLAAWLAQPLLRRKLARRGLAEPGYLHAVDERFGRYAMPRPCGAGPLVWLHAVSLGETRAAAILLPALRAALPGMRLLLTHGTATGRAEGAQLLQAGDVQVWQPWDTRGAARRFLAHFRPDIGLLMETEIWPALMHEAAARGLPVALVNARLSERSLRRAQRAGWLMRPAYAALAAAWAQTEADAQRLRQIGAPVAGVLGNLKFDARPDPALLARGQAWRAASARPVVLLASAREGEEAALLDCLKRPLPPPPLSPPLPPSPPTRAAAPGHAPAPGAVAHMARAANAAAACAAPATPAPDTRPDAAPRAAPRATSGSACTGAASAASANPSPGPAPDKTAPAAAQAAPPATSAVQWLIVPRHPQRFDAVAALIRARGFTLSRRSEWDAARQASNSPAEPQAPPANPATPAAPTPDADIWLGDSLGEMPAYYALASAALLGGSFAPLGGQNLIEAAACGCPVIMGPHTFNFAQAAQDAQAAQAACRAANMPAAVAQACTLAQSAPAQQAMRQAALAFAAAHRGAAQRTAQAVRQLLAQRQPQPAQADRPNP